MSILIDGIFMPVNLLSQGVFYFVRRFSKMERCKKFLCIYKDDNKNCQEAGERCIGRKCECWGECGNCAREYECDEE